VNSDTVTPFLKSAPSVAESRLFRLTSASNPAPLVVETVIVGDSVIVVERFGRDRLNRADGARDACRVAASVTSELPVSFSIVRIGLENVSARLV